MRGKKPNVPLRQLLSTLIVIFGSLLIIAAGIIYIQVAEAEPSAIQSAGVAQQDQKYNVTVRKSYEIDGQVILQESYSYEADSSSDANHSRQTLAQSVSDDEKEILFVYTDHLGSANTVAEAGANNPRTSRFLPFGEVWGGNDGAIDATGRGFTGHRENRGLGLTYMNARFYLPSVGRFASADTIVADPTNPQALNRYSYVYNNPILFNDPSGHIACDSQYLETQDQGACAGTSEYSSLTPVQTAFFMIFPDKLSYFERENDGYVALGKPPVADRSGLIDLAIQSTNWLLGETSDRLSAGETAERYTLYRDGARASAWAGLNYAESSNRMLNSGLNRLGSAPCNSFSAETWVTTDRGLVPISEIRLGEMVLAYHEELGEVDYYEVTDIFEHYDSEIVYLTINGELVETTPWHLFFTSTGWEEAEDLHVSSLIMQPDGQYGFVQHIESETKTQLMYDLTVDDAHTFFVGSGQWLVHNQNCPFDADDLFRATQVRDKGGMNRAGRALQKHGNRQGSKWAQHLPSGVRNPKSYNASARDLVQDMLTSPNTIMTTKNSTRHGLLYEFWSPDGRGLRFDASGNFMGFLN